MPLYEYKCNVCGKNMELFLSDGKKKPLCKYCGSKELTRLLSTFNTSEGGKVSDVMSNCPTGTCNLTSK